MKFLSCKNLELLYQFRILNEKFLDVLLKNFGTVVETVLACPGYSCKKKNVVENCAEFFCSFCLLIDYSSFVSKFVRLGCQNCTLCAGGTNWRKNCFEKMYKNITIFGPQSRSSRTFGGNFGQFCQNCTSYGRGSFLRKNICFDTNIYSKTFFRRRANSFRPVF